MTTSSTTPQPQSTPSTDGTHPLPSAMNAKAAKVSLLSLMIVGALALTGCAYNPAEIRDSKRFAVDMAIPVSATFSKIDISTELADLDIQYGELDEVDLRYKSKSNQTKISCDVKDDTLQIIETIPKRPFNSSSKLTLILPRSLENKGLTIQSAVGDTEIKGAFTNVVITSDVGDVDVDLWSPTDLDISSDVGSVNVTVPSDTDYAVAVNTDIGDVSVDIPNNAQAAQRISVKSSLGDVTIGY